eukprot:CAMPEP_0197538672 /NCGR_PEP_ID=MMETSP1318-20131121/60297_1 /TAXON_ID=552666 /ORGANISM="Partenskyella glossopodia, Strain RCC365" /LENGTH=87 /DNA_ID=CAMNT_0043097153 /DNA_START=53 /DNA_END=316 /DNA_ORIENTATION=+
MGYPMDTPLSQQLIIAQIQPGNHRVSVPTGLCDGVGAAAAFSAASRMVCVVDVSGMGAVSVAGRVVVVRRIDFVPYDRETVGRKINN